MEKTTLRNRLQKLPLQKRLQAMENIRKFRRVGEFNIILDTDCALGGSFVFSRSKQGHSYWFNIRLKYKI